MYVRLAFSVAAHLDPEVMIVDEVLAVGDAEFQKKCLGKMQSVAQSGRTVFFVSHNMQTVSQLCSTCFLLQTGRLVFSGPTAQAISTYVESQKELVQDVNPDQRPGSGEYRITSVQIEKTVIQSGDPIRAKFIVDHRHGMAPFFHTTFHLCDEVNTIVLHGDSRLQQFGITHKERQVVDLEISDVNLKPGTYRLDLMLHIGGHIDLFEGAATIDVSPVLPERLATGDFGYQFGQVIAEIHWSVANP
jgi:lipopolysaccharide transport system ATP-binding protein